MYARSELAGAHERWWAMIRKALLARNIPAPLELSQAMDEWDVWLSPSLILSQTCGMPYRIFLHDRVTLVGTPDYGLDGCRPGFYRSAIVVRAGNTRQTVEDFATARFAFNQTHSQSGFAAAYRHCAERGLWFAEQIKTGSHLASARMVADGLADIASLDAVSWRLMQRYEVFAAELRVIDWTVPSPGLPLIAGPDADADMMFDAVSEAIERLTPEDLEALGLRGLVRLPAADYLAVPNPPSELLDANELPERLRTDHSSPR
ncbi:MAG: PhnD/SsuA/transferrin family substrate-binding protein [Pseudomonadota bacterium]